MLSLIGKERGKTWELIAQVCKLWLVGTSTRGLGRARHLRKQASEVGVETGVGRGLLVLRHTVARHGAEQLRETGGIK